MDKKIAHRDAHDMKSCLGGAFLEGLLLGWAKSLEFWSYSRRICEFYEDRPALIKI